MSQAMIWTNSWHLDRMFQNWLEHFTRNSKDHHIWVSRKRVQFTIVHIYTDLWLCTYYTDYDLLHIMMRWTLQMWTTDHWYQLWSNRFHLFMKSFLCHLHRNISYDDVTTPDDFDHCDSNHCVIASTQHCALIPTVVVVLMSLCSRTSHMDEATKYQQVITVNQSSLTIQQNSYDEIKRQ